MVCANGLLNDSRVLKTATSLSKAGYKVSLYGLSPHKTISQESPEVVRGFPFEIIRIKSPATELRKNGEWSADYKNFDAFTGQISELISRHSSAYSDISLLYTHDMYGIAVANRLRLEGSYEKIPWIHDCHEYVRGLTELPDDIRRFTEDEEKKGIASASKVFCVSPILANLLQKHYSIEKPIEVLNAPLLSSFDPEFKNILQDIKLPKDGRLLTYHGNTKEIRGVHYLVNALKYLPTTFHLAIITDSRNEYVDYLRKLAKDYQNRVHFLPYVDQAKVSSYLRGSFACVHPIENYPNSDLALPNKLFESYHAEIPFICSPLKAMARFLAKEGNGICAKSNSPEDLAEAIQSLAEKSKQDSVRRFTFTNKKDFSWEKMEEYIIQAADSLVLTSSKLPVNLVQKEIRVAHLPAFSAGQPFAKVRALKDLNIIASSFTLITESRYNFQKDKVLNNRDLLKFSNELAKQAQAFRLFLNQNLELLDFNILHFHARPLLYGTNIGSPTVGADFQVFRAFGKRILFHFRGSEIRMTSLFNRLNPFSWLKDEDINSAEFKELRKKKQVPFVFDEDEQIDFLNKVNRIADHVLVTDPELKSYAPNSLICPRIVNSHLFEIGSQRVNGHNISKFSSSRPFVIGHAPSRPYIKGTPFLLNAVEELQRDGYHIKLELMTNMSNEEVIQRCQYCDLIVDQLRIGWYGVFAVEAMAMGLPTVCYIRDDLFHYLPFPSPLINSNPNLIKKTIVNLYNQPSELKTLSTRAYEYCKATHAPVVVGKFLDLLYRKLESIPLDPSKVRMSEYENAFMKEYINAVKCESSDIENLPLETTSSSFFLKALRNDSQSNHLMAIYYYWAHLVFEHNLSYVDKSFVLSRVNRLRFKNIA